MTSLSDQVINKLFCGVTEGDIVLNQKQRTHSVRVRVQENCVVDLLEAELVQDLLSLRRHIAGLLDSDGEDKGIGLDLLKGCEIEGFGKINVAI